MLFKKSENEKRTPEELVDHCVESLSKINGIDLEKIMAAKSHRRDSLSFYEENPDMNL